MVPECLTVSNLARTTPHLPFSVFKDSENPARRVGLGEATATRKPRVTSSTGPHPTRNRFGWLRRHGGGKGKARNRIMWSGAVSDGDPRFEKTEHPFVVLKGNRATCFICLEGFAEPKRKKTAPAPSPRQKTLEPIPPSQDGDEIERDSPNCHAALGKGPTRGGVPLKWLLSARMTSSFRVKLLNF